MNKPFRLLGEGIKTSILKQLMKKELSFSHLLLKTGVRDHGQLNYHLKLMIRNGLIEKSDGFYRTNFFGKQMGVYLNQFSGKEMYPIPVVCALVLNKKGQVLMLRRDKYPEKGKWGFPAGKLVFGKSINYSAEKALYEETAVRLKAQKTLGFFPTIRTQKGKIVYHVLLIVVLMKQFNPDSIIRLNDEQGDFKFMLKKDLKNYKLVAFDRDILDAILMKGFAFREFGRK